MDPNPYEAPKEEASQYTFPWKRLAQSGMVVGIVCLVPVLVIPAFSYRPADQPALHMAVSVVSVISALGGLGGLVVGIAGAIGWTISRR